MKEELFNWYETKQMKELLPKSKPYDYSKTGIEPNSRILCCGTTGSGKTQALLHYIRLSPKLFSRIIVFYKESEKMYELLQQAMKGKIEFHTDLAELPKLKDLRKDMDDEERILLVLDDWMMELKNYPNINDYFVYSRKKNCQIFCLAQNYYTVSKSLRNQMTYLILFEMISKRDINLIISDFDNKRKELLPIYKKIVKTPLNFMKIEVRTNKKFPKLSEGFTNYIDFNYDD
jgi:energy-coupling factor transporter ATP-binding protein EcfA2